MAHDDAVRVNAFHKFVVRWPSVVMVVAITVASLLAADLGLMAIYLLALTAAAGPLPRPLALAESRPWAAAAGAVTFAEPRPRTAAPCAAAPFAVAAPLPAPEPRPEPRVSPRAVAAAAPPQSVAAMARPRPLAARPSTLTSGCHSSSSESAFFRFLSTPTTSFLPLPFLSLAPNTVPLSPLPLTPPLLTLS